MRPITRLALDIGDQPLGGQRREDALMRDLDDVHPLLIEDPGDMEQGPRPILQADAQPGEPARPRQVAQRLKSEN